MVNKQFDKLYKFLLDKKLVTLGLYRLSGATDNNYSYVFTNPEPKTNVTQRDRIFVLGEEVPKDLIINTDTRSQDSKSMGLSENITGQKSKEQISKNILPSHKDFYGLTRERELKES